MDKQQNSAGAATVHLHDTRHFSSVPFSLQFQAKW
jgi:hypothetical protein